MKRVFVAVVFDEPFKDYLEDIQQLLKNSAQKGKYHLKENFHLTLEFIGNVEDEKIDILWKNIQTAIDGMKGFQLITTGLHCFMKKNKTIPWIGVEENQQLLELQKLIQSAVCDSVDHVAVHSYTPHITLGRQVLIETLPKWSGTYTYEVKEVVLMESSSSTGVLRYTPLFRHNLENYK